MSKKFTPPKLIFSLSCVLGIMGTLMGFQDSDLSIQLSKPLIPICPSSSTGEIDIEISGGSGTYNFEWEGPDNFSRSTEDIQNLSPGTYTVMVYDRNNNSLSASDSFKVVEEDLIAPAAPTLEKVEGECSVTVTAPTTTDNCAGTITGTTTDALTYDKQGTYLISWSFNDGNGNITTATQTVVVDDNTAPVKPSLAPVTGECSVTVTAPTTTDNCAGTITGTTTDALTYDKQGTYLISWSFNDGNGNITTATQTVVVDDITPPVKPSLAPVTGECSVTVTAPTTTDNCAGTITGTTTDALTYDKQGTYLISWSFNDGNGNITTATQTVVVDDITPPVKPSLAPVTGECSVTVTAPTTTDNCAGTITGTTTDALTYDKQGTYLISWSFNDGNGNITTADQEVVVDDNTAPVKPSLAPVTGECSVTVTAPTTTDNCAGTITGTTTDALTYDKQGTYLISWSFNDGNGNITTATQTVVVDDITPPVEPTLAPVTGECSVTVTAPTTTDNCTGTITGTTTDSLTYDKQGTYVITWNFNDGHGNITTAVQTVVVDDITPPVIPQLIDITWGCAYTLTPPRASDNCSGVIEGTTENLIVSTPGENRIIWTFDDGNGNIVTKDQIVVITPLEIDPIIVPVSCHGLTNGSLEINTSGGVAPLQFSINGGNYTTNYSFQNLPAGDYFIKIKDKNGCETEEEFTVDQPLELKSITSPISQKTSCFQASDGIIISGEVAGGTPFTDDDGNEYYKYSINNVDFINYMVGEQARFEGLGAGDYTIFLKDKNGCGLQQSIIVEEPSVLKAVLNKNDVRCFDEKNGEIFITNPTGGSGNYEFSIDGESWVSTDQIIKDLDPGYYNVQMRDADSEPCVLSLGNITISQPPKLEVEIIPSPTTEFGTPTGSAVVNATGGVPGYTYKWQKYEGDTWMDLSTQTRTINNLTAGKYRAIVTDQNGCSTIDQANEFVIIDKITANISIFSSCNDSENDIRISEFNILPGSVFGGLGEESTYQYRWDFGTNASTSNIFVKRSASSVPVAVTGNFIGDHDDVFIVPYNKIGNQTITLTVIDSNTNPATETTITFTHLVNSCFTECGNANDIDVSVSDFFIGKKLSDGTFQEVINCEENSDQLYLVAKFKTSKTTKLSVELEYTLKPEGGTPEVYSVDIVHAVDLNKVTYFPIFKIGDGEDDIHWKCGDDFEILFASFDWDKPGQGNSGQPHCLGINVQVPVPTPLKATAIGTNIDCFGQETGTIVVSVSGGSGNYLLEAVNSSGEKYFPTSNTTTFNNLPAENYTVRIADGKYPDIFIEIGIVQPEELAAVVNSTNPTCYADPALNNFTGNAEVTGVTGGTPPYFYEWNDPERSKDQSVQLVPGSYTVTITDSKNCSLTLPVVIEQKEPITEPEAGPDVELQCGISKVALEANIPNSAIGEVGTWRVISGQPETEYFFGIGTSGTTTSNDPNAIFQANSGEYELVWEISNTNQSAECTKTSNPIKIVFNGNCTNLDFDGIDDHINFGDNFGLTSGKFTLEAWIKPEELSGARTILSKRDTRNPGSGGYDFLINSGVLTFRRGNSSVSTSFHINTDRWYHVAVISHGSKVELYVDGIIVGTSSSGSNPTVTTSPFLIGAVYNSSTPANPSNYFSGFIEEARIWDKPLTPEELHFIMNQRVEKIGVDGIQGEVIKNSIFERNGEVSPIVNLKWSNLLGYYHLLAIPAALSEGLTKDISNNQIHGLLKNIETLQENTAPLPYVLNTTDGAWFEKSTWELPARFEERDIVHRNVWDAPSSMGIDKTSRINWNIVKLNGKSVRNPGTSNNSNKITLLGLIDEGGHLNMMGEPDATGNGLTITHYLKLDGLIDLNGESQLVQPEGSIAEGTGQIHRDQQGTASSFNYNYWSSPVLQSSTAENYFVKDVLFDGSFPNDQDYPKPITFGVNPFFADNARAPQGTAIKISETWLNAFYPEGDENNANQYSAWRNIRSNRTAIRPGEGFTMKGSWYISVKDAEDRGLYQNYTFKGFPNNGDIVMRKTFPNQNYLVGNPYPSAISVEKFITENEGAMNGAIYFWDHFSGMSHYLQEYIGGYAVRNILDGVPAISTDERINANLQQGSKRPGDYIPVGQGFFINTTIDDQYGSGNPGAPGNIIFKNEFREYVTEADPEDSQFHSVEKKEKKEKTTTSKRPLIRLNFTSPKGYWRQISVAADPKATSGVDYGFDAQTLDSPSEDMFWMIDDRKFVIQGISHFNLKQVLPLGIKISQAGIFSIEVATIKNLSADTPIYIHDKEFDLYYNISEKKFSAKLEPGEYKTRFEIVFEEPKLIDKSEVILPGELKILYANGTRIIKINNPGLKKISKVHLNNILGQQVASYHHIPTEHQVDLPVNNYSSGVYIVKAHTEEGVITQKIIIE